MNPVILPPLKFNFPVCFIPLIIYYLKTLIYEAYNYHTGSNNNFFC